MQYDRKIYRRAMTDHVYDIALCVTGAHNNMKPSVLSTTGHIQRGTTARPCIRQMAKKTQSVCCTVTAKNFQIPSDVQIPADRPAPSDTIWTSIYRVVQSSRLWTKQPTLYPRHDPRSWLSGRMHVALLI